VGDPSAASESVRLIDEDAATLYDEAPCGYLYTRPDGTLLRVNRTFLEWTGFTKSEVLGRRFQDMLSIGGRIFHETHFAPLLHMQGFVNEIALDVVTRSGALLPVLVNSVQKRDPNGAPLLVRTTVFNATDRKTYERELQLARARAEESARAKSELLSTISHDIRSPLGAILAAAQLLEKSQLAAPQQTFVRVLRSSSETLLSLVNNVLDLSRIESGRTRIERRSFDLRELVLDVMAAQNVHAEAKGLALRVAIDDSLPATLAGDPVKIGQIITNLVSNAVKFTERGSVALTLRVTDARSGRVDVEFSVADTGIGIPSDRLANIFDEFTQASPDVSARYGGSGLGLAIVRRLVELHGSRIAVESELGRGTIFSFVLALDAVEEHRPPASNIGSDEAVARARLLSGKRILLIEENAFDAFIVGKALSSWGVAFDLSQSLSDASTRLGSAQYDAVLLGIRPEHADLDSVSSTMLGAVHHGGPRPQLIVLARSTADAAKLTTAGNVPVLAKPVDTSVLFAKLASGTVA
jgi:PAS domain S-box-containing protein